MRDRGEPLGSEPVYTQEDIDILSREATAQRERHRREDAPLPVWEPQSFADRLLTRVFGAPEEINGHRRCPTYLYRWVVGGLFGCKLYVHHFVGDDWSLDLHDHPKRFITIGLRGRYHETYARKQQYFYGPDMDWFVRVQEERDYQAPWVRTFPAEHAHRITVAPGEDCWTLVLVLRTVREWGFWHDGKLVNWREFVNSAVADETKACP